MTGPRGPARPGGGPGLRDDPSGFWPRRLGAKIGFLLALSVAVPLAVSETYGYVLARRVTHERTEVILATRAEQLVDELDGFNRLYLAAARRLSRAPQAARALAGGPSHQARELREYLAALSDSDDAILAAELVDARGRIALASLPDLEGLDVSFRPSLREALRGASLVSDPFFAPPVANEVPVVAYVSPVFGKGGSVVGAAAVLVRANALWQAVRTGNERAGPGSFSLLLDSTGIRLGHSKRDDGVFRPAAPLERPVIEELVREQRFGRNTRALLEAPLAAPVIMQVATAAAAPPAAAFRVVSPFDGQANVVSARRLRSVGWTLFHLVPVATVEAPARQVALAVIPAVVAGALVILFSLLAARRALRPARELAEAAEAVARGESARVCVRGSDELAHLARRFNQMAAAVELARAGLEVRVQQRTQALSVANAELEAQKRELVAQREVLERQRVELEHKNEEVLRADRLKSEFLANMSHELRTPLHAIIGFSELLAEQAGPRLTAPERRWLDDVQGSGTHLLTLINDVLDLSKIEAGQLTLELDEVAPLATIADVTELMLPAARKRGIAVRVLGAAVSAVRGDPRRLRQVLLNLLSNALKFAPDGSAVEVEAVERDGHVRFSVRDHGPGLDDALRARLFRPFVQGENPLVKRHQGAGLGLAICRRLVEMHGGTIGVESTPGEGAAFHFTVPLARAGAADRSRGAGAALPDGPAERGPRLEAVEDAARPGARPATAGTAVIIDDNELSRDLARTLLERRGWRVLAADGGERGLDLVRSARPSLVVCDLAMPGMDGLAVARALKAAPETAGIALAALTALAMPGDDERAYAAGFDAYLSKPIDQRALDAALARLAACPGAPGCAA